MRVAQRLLIVDGMETGSGDEVARDEKYPARDKGWRIHLGHQFLLPLSRAQTRWIPFIRKWLIDRSDGPRRNLVVMISMMIPTIARTGKANACRELSCEKNFNSCRYRYISCYKRIVDKQLIDYLRDFLSRNQEISLKARKRTKLHTRRFTMTN